jgi:hypothetical protein
VRAALTLRNASMLAQVPFEVSELHWTETSIDSRRD